MIAYKGFHEGLVCLGYQFQMGLNVTQAANCGRNGFHCAEDPLDCLSYYSNLNTSEYCIVSAGGDIHEDGSDSKISCTELTIIRKLSRMDLFLHALAFMVDHPKRKWSKHVHTDKGIATQSNPYAVVRGSDPVACGPKGSILAFAREDQNRNIVQIALTEVDGVRIRPNKWYGIDLIAREDAA